MKRILFTLFIFIPFISFAQSAANGDTAKEAGTLLKRIKKVEDKNAALDSEVRTLKATLSDYNQKIDSLYNQVNANSGAIQQTMQELKSKISSTEGKIVDVDHSSNKKSVWAIIGVLLALLISGVLYWLLSRTKSSINENLLKEFGKQTEMMDTQLELIKLQKESMPNAEPDHSMALRVANEINLIERNIQMMGAGTKGFKQLTRSVEKLRDNLAASGYEIPQLLGMPFHQGMKVIVTASVPDEKLEKGSEIISKIWTPLVNYEGKMIQTAQIEVSVGY